MAADSELRQRKTKADDSTTTTSSAPSRAVDDNDAPSSVWVDVLRVLTFLVVASCGLSYVITGGSSWVWGGVQLPEYASVSWWKAYMSGPVYFTPEQLSAFDGSDPEKPLYLAINGTVYDVSKSRHIYGPGGSYSFFAGADASRAFVTGCFADDITPDMRGVEELYLPLDDPEVDAHWTSTELKIIRARERQTARKRAHDALDHWVQFFATSPKYTKVGYVKMEEGWLEKQPRRELCDVAKRGRAKRKVPDSK